MILKRSKKCSGLQVLVMSQKSVDSQKKIVFKIQKKLGNKQSLFVLIINNNKDTFASLLQFWRPKFEGPIFFLNCDICKIQMQSALLINCNYHSGPNGLKIFLWAVMPRTTYAKTQVVLHTMVHIVLHIYNPYARTNSQKCKQQQMPPECPAVRPCKP